MILLHINKSSQCKNIFSLNMKLVVFFILAIGALAHPNKRSTDEKSDVNNNTNTELTSTLAVSVIQGVSGYRIVWLTPILSRYWLLSPHDYTSYNIKEDNITVETIIDLLSSNVQRHEIEFIIKSSTQGTQNDEYNDEEDSLLLMLIFSLIKLKKPLIFGDVEKPIPIDWRSEELKTDSEAKIIRLTLNHIAAGKDANPNNFITISSAKIMNEERCQENLKSYRLLYHQMRNHQLFCTKNEKKSCNIETRSIAIVNGKLAGYSLRSCNLYSDKKVPFLKMSLLYDWIVEHIPQLKIAEE